MVIFAIALVRINRIVREIEEAYPNKVCTVVHFGLVISILFFNVVNLLEMSIGYTNQDKCNTSLNKASFAFAVSTWFWDLVELSLDLLLLYIVSTSTDVEVAHDAQAEYVGQTYDTDMSESLSKDAKQHRS